MPTGYTAKLMEKGQSFPEFVTTCARAMGALIMMRDDPMDTPIPERFEPSDYSAKKIAAARATLAHLAAMSKSDALAYGEQAKKEAITERRKYIVREGEENERVDAMFDQVRAWKPPTKEHQGFKDFMLEQLSVSRNNSEWAEKWLEEAIQKPARAWYDDALAAAERDIAYHEKSQAEEEERTAGRNAWVAALLASI